MYSKELKQLYISMRENEIDSQKFQISHNGIDFECVFSLREEPFSLSFTSLGIHRVFVLFYVRKGFDLDPNLSSSEYSKLARLFRNNNDSFVKFQPSVFLKEISNSFPSVATLNNRATPQDTIRHRRDIEDADKIYFIGWTHHTGKTYKEENLRKTILAFGQEAGNYQIRNNASSKWSDIPNNRNDWRNI